MTKSFIGNLSPKINLILPSKNGNSTVNELIEVDRPIVILGANGSGKSRLGAWIEQKNSKHTIHRISSQKVLSIPDVAPIKTSEEAINELIYGTGQLKHIDVYSKNGYRWQNQPINSLLNDYEKVLSALFAQASKRDSEYVTASQLDNSDEKLPIPLSNIEKLIAVWDDVFPHRSIKLVDGKVTVNTNGGLYHGKEMSDGERVALYLIGQCLSVPENAVLIIDEPELHLHKSLMNRLWNKLEEIRDDCKFLYITHDLDFASSRTKAIKIWVKTFSAGDIWTWELVPEVENLPESVILEILGSRKPILFVEGGKGSYDFEIYQHLFPNFTIIPREGWMKVVEATKTLQSNHQLHRVEAYGVIDRDYRSSTEIESLIKQGVLIIDVAEVENLLCTPEIIRIIAEYLLLDPNEIINQVTEYILNQLYIDFERIISFRSALEINYKLNAFNQKALGRENLKKAITDLGNSIDVDEIYDRNKTFYQQILDSKDLLATLKNYKNKGLLKNISRIFELDNKKYADLILRLLKTDKKQRILNALKPFVPLIPLKEYPSQFAFNIGSLKNEYEPLLDKNTLELLLDALLPVGNKREDSYNQLLLELYHFSLGTERKLKQLIFKQMQNILLAEKFQVENQKPVVDTFFSHVGLTRLAIKFEFNLPQSQDLSYYIR